LSEVTLEICRTKDIVKYVPETYKSPSVVNTDKNPPDACAKETGFPPGIVTVKGEVWVIVLPIPNCPAYYKF
jgi:hypothetical protein